MKTNKKSGFTLIELVVVIAIIGVLATIITPRVRTSLLKSKDAKAIASLDALRTASNVFNSDKGMALATAPDAAGASQNQVGLEVTSVQLTTLLNSGYIDQKTVDGLLKANAAKGASIEVGSIYEPSQCTATDGTGSLIKNAVAYAGYLAVFFNDDGVGMTFKTDAGNVFDQSGAAIPTLVPAGTVKDPATGAITTAGLVNMGCQIWDQM